MLASFVNELSITFVTFSFSHVEYFKLHTAIVRTYRRNIFSQRLNKTSRHKFLMCKSRRETKSEPGQMETNNKIIIIATKTENKH